MATKNLVPAMSRFVGGRPVSNRFPSQEEVIDLDTDDEDDVEAMPGALFSETNPPGPSQQSQTSVISSSGRHYEYVSSGEDSDEDALDRFRAHQTAASSSQVKGNVVSQATASTSRSDHASTSHHQVGALQRLLDDLRADSGEPTATAKRRRNSGELEMPNKKKKTTQDEGTYKSFKTQQREAEKARKEEDREQKRLEKQQAKEAKALERAQAKADKQREKEANKNYAEANKLVSDKKKTIADLTVEVSSALMLHAKFGPCVHEFQNRLGENGGNLLGFDSQYPFMHVMRWRRRVDKEYDEEAREWRAVEPYDARDPLFAIFYTAQDLLVILQQNPEQAMEAITLVKSALEDETGRLELGDKDSVRAATEDYQVLVVVLGVRAACRPPRGNELFATLQAFSMKANIYHRAHVILCDDEEEFAQRLHDISADQGIKPYKLIRRTHLPYVADINISTGGKQTETYKHMLSKIYKFTDPVVETVFEAKPTLNQLMRSYAEIGDQAQRELLFERSMVHRLTKAGETSRSMNASLSRRLHSTMYGTNPLAFVGPDNAADMHH